jgi:hypothetical protein
MLPAMLMVEGSKFNKARAVTDFPHPDSPTIPSLSPNPREKFRSSTTVNRRFRCFRKT